MTKSRLLQMNNVGIVVESLDIYRLCYIRGTEGMLIGLAEELSSNN